MSGSIDHPKLHFLASAIAAGCSWPLWRISAQAQAGYGHSTDSASLSIFAQYKRAFKPPYKGLFATIGGMTWARGFIFYTSEWGQRKLEQDGVRSKVVTTTLPPLLSSVFVQLVNQPLVRSTIMIQNPRSKWKSTTQAMQGIYTTRGLGGLWHGLSAGVLKTIPKYVVAHAVKDYMEHKLPLPADNDRQKMILRSAVKGITAGALSAGLTNPMDVLRNEMFKRDTGLVDTCRNLQRTKGFAWCARGMAKNMTAVAAPIAICIFVTDVLTRYVVNNRLQ